MGYKDELEAAQFTVENKIGQVLSSGSAILAVKARASAYLSSNNPAVVSQAQAVISKAQGLISELNSIQSDAVGTAGLASKLDAAMSSDPTWAAILGGNTGNLGWQSLIVVQKYISDATTVTQQLYTLSNRVDDHLNGVQDLQSNESDLENFAAGHGVRAALSTFSGAVVGAEGIATNYISMIKYAAVAAVAFFAWDAAKPFLAARRVHKNPRRRYRRG